MNKWRNILAGYSKSEFKTLLKKWGYKRITRNFFTNGSVTHRDNRLVRIRWQGTVSFGPKPKDTTPMVDVSCTIAEFDRWANSVDRRITIPEWLFWEKTARG